MFIFFYIKIIKIFLKNINLIFSQKKYNLKNTLKNKLNYNTKHT